MLGLITLANVVATCRIVDVGYLLTSLFYGILVSVLKPLNRMKLPFDLVGAFLFGEDGS